MAATTIAIEDVEIQLLVDGLVRVTGFDFRDYDPAFVKRRVETAMALESVMTVSALQDKALHDQGCLERVLAALTARRGRMFANPQLFLGLRSLVIPLLRTYPFLRIWHMGCGYSEETYSVCICLLEEGLYDRCKIYATDALDSVIGVAKTGVYAAESVEEWSKNYALSGGKRALTDYLISQDGVVSFDPVISKNIIFARHNVVSDASFNEFHLILCSNVLSQFNFTLQSRVYRLMHTSLIRLGFLVVGSGESMQGSPFEQHYQLVDKEARIYRRMS